MKTPKTLEEVMDRLRPTPLNLNQKDLKTSKANSALFSKKSSPILLVDASSIAYQIYHRHCAGTKCSLEDVSDIVTAKLFNEYLALCKTFDTSRLIFCLDSKTNKRKEMVEGYKGDRNKYLSDAEVAKIIRMKKTLRRFGKIVNRIWGNAFIQKGHESDDIIGIFVRGHREAPFIIVGNDADLYQLLRRDVSYYNITTGMLIRSVDFMKQYGYFPFKVIAAKSIAGCTSDRIKGVGKVGEKRVAELIQGRTDHLDKVLKNWGKVLENKRIVCLPLEGTKMPTVTPFKMNVKAFLKCCDKYGLPQLAKKAREFNALFKR